ncbi:MAG: 50S ribosomal protein L21, partial [Caldiserica bacterium]|nr:50S ribosomal protein L21 [Caldisericota bacterium]
MYAVIEAAGRQYRVELGETVKMEKIASEPGTPIVFDKVLVVTTDAGTQIGKPYVLDAKVSGTIVR